MSSAAFEVVFQGRAVETGKIDARLLADSLAGYSEVFTRANAVINGELSHAAVFVQSDFRQGSFVAGLELVQTVAQNAVNLITGHHFQDAAALANLIGFAPAEFGKEVVKDLLRETVISLFKRFKGKKPDEVKPVGDDKVEIKAGGESRVVHVNVFNLYGDSAIRSGLDKLTSPLRQADIDRIAVKDGNKEEVVVEKSEAEYFKAEPLKLESESDAMSGERDAVLIVAKLSFKEGSRWTFFERGATVVAKIEDQEFWERIHKNEVSFGEGDVLKVRLVWEIQRKRHELKQKNTVVKVLEKLERPKQMRLDGRKDDDVAMQQPKGRKFRD